MKLILERKHIEVFKVDLYKTKESKDFKWIAKMLQIAMKKVGLTFQDVKEFFTDLFDYESYDAKSHAFLTRLRSCSTILQILYALLDVSKDVQGWEVDLDYILEIFDIETYGGGSKHIRDNTFLNAIMETIEKYFANKLDEKFEGLSLVDEYEEITSNDSDYKY